MHKVRVYPRKPPFPCEFLLYIFEFPFIRHSSLKCLLFPSHMCCAFKFFLILCLPYAAQRFFVCWIMRFSYTSLTGIWSPGNTPEPVKKQFGREPPPASPSTSRKHQTVTFADKAPTPPPPPPFWTPKSVESSPTFERKEFRPVRFESPSPQRKTYTSQRQVSLHRHGSMVYTSEMSMVHFEHNNLRPDLVLITKIWCPWY